jgi:hypothetical protein
MAAPLQGLCNGLLGFGDFSSPARFRTIQVGRSLYLLEVPMAQALLGEHLIPAAAQVRQIGVAVWRLRRGLGVGGKGGGTATATHPVWLPPHRHTRDRAR